MKEDKGIDGRGHCEEHQCWYWATRGCPKCYPERYPQPNLPNLPTRSEGKPARVNRGEGYCSIHNLKWPYRVWGKAGCPKCVSEPPAPPTDPERPDVETLQEEAVNADPEETVIAGKVLSVCNYALDLERRLKQVETAYGKAMDQVKALNQAEVELTEKLKAVERLLADVHDKSKDFLFDVSGLGLPPDIWQTGTYQSLSTALAAAKQYFDKGEKTDEEANS